MEEKECRWTLATYTDAQLELTAWTVETREEMQRLDRQLMELCTREAAEEQAVLIAPGPTQGPDLSALTEWLSGQTT